VADGGAASVTQDPAARIRVSDEVRERFPSFRLRVLYAFGIRNGPSDAISAYNAFLWDNFGTVRS